MLHVDPELGMQALTGTHDQPQSMFLQARHQPGRAGISEDNL